MAIQGKCDVCRIRKVKCDEARPSCSQCSKKARPCTYHSADHAYKTGSSCRRVPLGSRKSGHESNPQSLQVRTIRLLPGGDGLYTTLALGKRRPGKNVVAVSTSPRQSSSVESEDNVDAPEPEDECPITHLDVLTATTDSAIDLWGSRSPGNQTSQLICDLIAVFQVSDLRYNIFTFALYFKDLPRRLGSNNALDAAVGAFTAAFQVMRTGIVTRTALRKYGIALKVLRESLYDSETAQSAETLCAVHLVWISQPWIGFEEYHNSHAAGVARILNYTSAKEWKDPFDAELVFTITSIMAFESALNPNVELDPMLLKLVPEAPYHRHKPAADAASKKSNPLDGADTIMLQNFMHMLHVFRQPEELLHEVEFIYNESQTKLASLAPVLAYLEDLVCNDIKLPCITRPSLNMRLQWAYRRIHGILLFASLVMNQYLYAAYPSRYWLVTEADVLTMDILEHAQVCLQYRPIGSIHVPLCLAAALAANKDHVHMRTVIKAMMEEYQPGGSQVGWSLYEESYVSKLVALRAKYHPEERWTMSSEWDDCRVQ